jgi:transcriptional regulator with XRE-family HTH domain
MRPGRRLLGDALQNVGEALGQVLALRLRRTQWQLPSSTDKSCLTFEDGRTYGDSSVRTPYGYMRGLTPYGDIVRLDTLRLQSLGEVMQVTTVHQIQALVRGRRRELGLSQESLARSAGASRKWLSEFERGTTTAVELPLVLRVLAALDLAVDVGTNKLGVADLSAGSDQDRGLDLDEVLSDYTNRDQR